MTISERPNCQQMRLYGGEHQRLYINAHERERFLKAARGADLETRSAALLLVYTGCRISEAVNLTIGHIQLETGCLSIRTLKKRDKLLHRELPIPKELVDCLTDLIADRANERHVWERHRKPITRLTMYRWMGHSSIKTTEIYAQAIGPEERMIAERMWN